MTNTTQTAAAQKEPLPTAQRRRERRIANSQNLGLLVFLAALVVVFALSTPVFFTLRNFTNLLLAVAVIGIMAAVGTLVLVSANLDLSIGSIVALTGVVVAKVVAADGITLLGVIAALVVGILCGLFNGLIVTRVAINPIITTIATLSLFRGIAFIVTEGRSVPVTDPTIIFSASGRILGVPASVWIMVATFWLVHVIASRTRIGRELYAVGANERASLLSGLPVKRRVLGVFVASGLAAAVAGVLLTGLAGSAAPSAAEGYEFLVVTALLLGGASLFGGVGSVLGTFLGLLIIGVLTNGMTLLGIDSFYQTAANGALLLIALAFDQYRRTRQASH